MGAWIETYSEQMKVRFGVVAPYMGAWIETLIAANEVKKFELSHPTWVRGLKRSSGRASTGDMLSHPTWVRGLKLILESVKCGSD